MMSSLSLSSSSTKDKLAPPVNFDRVLQEHHSDLRQCLSLQELIPLLRKHELLTKEEWEEISCKQTHQKKIDHLVQLLPRKGEHAYEKFVTCLESEKEHPSHLELADKIKKTAEEMTALPTPIPTITYDTKPEPSMAMVVEQVTEALKSSVSKYVHGLEDKISSLEKQLQEKDKLIAEVQNNCCRASAEVLKFQKLLEYSNSSHGSQLTLDINTQQIARHYHDIRNILRSVKAYLKQDADYIHRNIDTASEESDYNRSRTSSVDSQFYRPMYKIPLARSPLSNPSLREVVMKESLKSIAKKPSTSDSSANEADDEHLITQTARPESWPASKKKRAAKTISHHSESDANHHTYTDKQSEDELRHGKELSVGDPLPEEDTLVASADSLHSYETVSLDHEESSSSILEGYLQKEGSGEIPRKRYFTLTKEFLFYSKSKEDSRPLGMIPLIDLKLEKKKKATFEVINKRASLIKVKKPAKKNVQCYRAIRLKANNETEVKTWIKSIEDAIKELRTQYHT
ncbi:uncharacterized protein [Dysidea avara]|uniref:uncharacterized protein isoform X2 n=1 Tax=Dysidea avara TaxID=196820 RepID=UPI0033291B2C